MSFDLTGKRMRSDTEFESDTESVGSNSEGRNSLSNMNGNDPTEINYIDQTCLVSMYHKDTSHLSGAEVGGLLFNLSPSSVEYHIMTKKPPHLRKAALCKFQKISKDAPVQQRSAPCLPTVNQQSIVAMYDEDTSDLSGEELGHLIFHVRPTSTAYRAMALLPPDKRKAALCKFLKSTENAPEQRPSPHIST